MRGAHSLVTVSMSIDFISSAQIGQWLTVETDVIKTGSTICFAQCFVKADDVAIARANGDVPGGAEERLDAHHDPLHRPPKCQSLISVTRSMKVRTLDDNSREVG